VCLASSRPTRVHRLVWASRIAGRLSFVGAGGSSCSSSVVSIHSFLWASFLAGLFSLAYSRPFTRWVRTNHFGNGCDSEDGVEVHGGADAVVQACPVGVVVADIVQGDTSCVPQIGPEMVLQMVQVLLQHYVSATASTVDADGVCPQLHILAVIEDANIFPSDFADLCTARSRHLPENWDMAFFGTDVQMLVFVQRPVPPRDCPWRHTKDDQELSIGGCFGEQMAEYVLGAILMEDLKNRAKFRAFCAAVLGIYQYIALPGWCSTRMGGLERTSWHCVCMCPNGVYGSECGYGDTAATTPLWVPSWASSTAELVPSRCCWSLPNAQRIWASAKTDLAPRRCYWPLPITLRSWTSSSELTSPSRLLDTLQLAACALT